MNVTTDPVEANDWAELIAAFDAAGIRIFAPIPGFRKVSVVTPEGEPPPVITGATHWKRAWAVGPQIGWVCMLSGYTITTRTKGMG